MATRRARLHRLTERWRARHDARIAAAPMAPASAEREAQAKGAFPYREVSPRDYADAYGAQMAGFTFDDASYADAELDAWLHELGDLLRQRGVIRGG